MFVVVGISSFRSSRLAVCVAAVIMGAPLRLARYPQLLAARFGGIALMLVGVTQFHAVFGKNIKHVACWPCANPKPKLGATKKLSISATTSRFHRRFPPTKTYCPIAA